MKKTLIALIASFAFACVFAQDRADSVLTPEQLDKTEQAAPKKLFRKPGKARKILVYTKTDGYRHCEGIPAFNEMLKAMEKNFKGSWQITFTEDPAAFEEDNLKKFDCVVMNNTTGRFFVQDKKAREAMTDAERSADDKLNTKYVQNLASYVENGGGVMGLHAACDAQHGSKYVEMMGGLFAGHPWGAGNKAVTVLIEDPSNILLRGVWKNKEFQIQDEIYSFHDNTFSRDNQRVLMSLDLERSPLDNGEDPMKHTQRKEPDFGLAWVKTFGKGRIFYGAFGHRLDVFWRNPELAEFYMRGIQYACGDIRETPVKPLGALKTAPKKK